ncbi:MAG TPA: toprim domain-containing protein, partial [Pyrinomonadaceae bacterium]|nr:toprim domain-containing protein [Pyrinomonadaceae bacterium]
YHEKLLFADAPLPFPSKPPPPKVELAPIEIRDFAYRKLIELAPAINSKEIIDGEKGLRSRKILDFENYGALPPTMAERTAIARKIRNLINQNFSQFVRQKKSSITSIPGFWLEKNGNARIWHHKDYTCPLMVIPYRNEKGLIEACQLRYMGDLNTSLRYVWLSIPDKSDGLSCGSPLHFAAYRIPLADKPILITEGALKAETVKIFKPNINVIAGGGVNCFHEQIISLSRNCPIILGFDSDYAVNRQVARAFAKLIVSRLVDSLKCKYDFDLNVLTWHKSLKGIDDALLQNSPICQITPAQWFKTLSSTCQIEVARVFNDYDNLHQNPF